ncbi:hypothetical protein ACQKC1_02940, partial [Shewanella baltica]
MTSARRMLIDANTTPFYHVINRCVRKKAGTAMSFCALSPLLLVFRLSSPCLFGASHDLGQ